MRLFLEHEAQRAGKKFEEFFSKVDTPENIEDALDDAVDGKVQVVVELLGLDGIVGGRGGISSA